MDTAEKHTKTKLIWLMLVLFLLALTNTVWGLLYIKQTDERQQTSSQVASLKTEKINLNSKIRTLEATKNEALAETEKKEDTPQTQTWRYMPELGVKYKVSDKTKNLTWSYVLDSQERKFLYLSSVELTESGNKTKIASSSDPLVEYPCSSMDPRVVFLASKQKPPLEEGGDIAKKIGDYFYSYYTGKSMTECDTQQIAAVTDAAKEAFASLEAIE